MKRQTIITLTSVFIFLVFMLGVHLNQRVDAEKQHQEQGGGFPCNQHFQQGEAADDEVFRPVEHDNRSDVPVEVQHAEDGNEVRQQQRKLRQGPGG